jgi:hypothetical protein
MPGEGTVVVSAGVFAGGTLVPGTVPPPVAGAVVSTGVVEGIPGAGGRLVLPGAAVVLEPVDGDTVVPGEGTVDGVVMDPGAGVLVLGAVDVAPGTEGVAVVGAVVAAPGTEGVVVVGAVVAAPGTEGVVVVGAVVVVPGDGTVEGVVVAPGAVPAAALEPAEGWASDGNGEVAVPVVLGVVVGGTPGDGGVPVVAGAGGVVALGVGVSLGDPEVVVAVADRLVVPEAGGTAPGCGWNGGGSSGVEVCPSAIPLMVSSPQTVMPITRFTLVPPRAESRPPP